MFRLVLGYDLLEDRCTIDVIITEFLPLCFKMAESFENLDNILQGWTKDKVQKSVAEALNRFEKHESSDTLGYRLMCHFFVLTTF